MTPPPSLTDAQELELLAWVRGEDARALTLTLYGEGRGEPVEGRIAIGCVIRNRAAARYCGTTIAEVCLWPRQFSCWRATDGPANHAHLVALAWALYRGGVPPWSDVERAIYDETAWVASGLLERMIRDRVRGSRHYYAPAAMVPAGSRPAWSIRDGVPLPPTAVVGRQWFFAGIA